MSPCMSALIKSGHRRLLGQQSSSMEGGVDATWVALATFEAGKQACDALRNFWKASGASFFSSANFRATKRFYGEL